MDVEDQKHLSLNEAEEKHCKKCCGNFPKNNISIFHFCGLKEVDYLFPLSKILLLSKWNVLDNCWNVGATASRRIVARNTTYRLVNKSTKLSFKELG